MNDTFPLVSIAVTTYNGSRYLRQQLDSLLTQDYPNIEIVVADDCSSDDTRLVLSEYEGNDQFRWYQNDSNLGYVKNFEKVIAKCKGEFIALCDQDDIWYPNKISRTMKEFNSDEIMLAYSNADLIAENDSLLPSSLMERMPISPIIGKGFRKFYFYSTVNGCCAVFRSGLYRGSAPFPDEVPHDWWLAYRAARLGGVSYVDERLLGYRQHDMNAEGISYSISLMSFFPYMKKKLKMYTGTFCVAKLNRPIKVNDVFIRRCRAYMNVEQATDELHILQQLLDWSTKRQLSNASLAEFSKFFEEYGESLGIRKKSRLLWSVGYEVLRAKIKLVYKLVVPPLVIVGFTMLALNFF